MGHVISLRTISPLIGDARRYSAGSIWTRRTGALYPIVGPKSNSGKRSDHAYYVSSAIGSEPHNQDLRGRESPLKKPLQPLYYILTSIAIS